MPSSEASTKQVLKWALNHAGSPISGAAIIGTLYVGWDHLQTQWNAHMKEGRVRDTRFEQLEAKLDRVQASLDRVLFILARRK